MRKIYGILGFCFMFLLSSGNIALATSTHVVASSGGTPNVAGDYTVVSGVFDQSIYQNGSYYLYNITTSGFPSNTYNSYISTSLPTNSYTASSGGTPDISGTFSSGGTYGGYPYYTNNTYYMYSYPNPSYPGMFQPETYCYVSDTLGASTTDYFFYAGLCQSANGFGHLVGQGSYSGNVDITLVKILPDNYFSSLGNLFDGTFIGNGTYTGTFTVSDYVAPTLLSGLEATVADADNGFYAITGTTMGSTTAWAGDNLIKPWLGVFFNFLGTVVWWVCMLNIIIMIIRLAIKQIKGRRNVIRTPQEIEKGKNG